MCVRLIDWSETSQVVGLLTRDYGKLSGLAKGAKRLSPSAVGRYSGGIELMTAGQVVANLRRNTELASITEWDLQRPFRHLRHQLWAYRLAMYGTDLANAMLEEHDPHPVVHDALLDLFEALADRETAGLALLRYQWTVLSDCGYRPELEKDVETGESISVTVSPSGAGNGGTGSSGARKVASSASLVLTFDPQAGGLRQVPASWLSQTPTPDKPSHTLSRGPQNATSDTTPTRDATGEKPANSGPGTVGWRIRRETVSYLRRLVAALSADRSTGAAPDTAETVSPTGIREEQRSVPGNQSPGVEPSERKPSSESSATLLSQLAIDTASTDRANRLLCSYARHLLGRQLPTMNYVLEGV